ncbi:Transcription elongation factor TFIIS [Camellia lanceoleosa]|uniref:Transcription elongation factor TFIIS n=1 Tax=Camellia lanceoleosa TaxID=1840588 RepID=A0ACC0J022_9ERIC|nr:Transcription elongation factor TFIIS [Camellia lanceoleosa]
MEKEVIALFQSAKKPANAAAAEGLDSSAEEERCIDVLNRLNKFPVDYELLLSTQFASAETVDFKKVQKKVNLVKIVKVSNSKVEIVKTEKIGQRSVLKPEKVTKSETISAKRKLENIDIKIEGITPVAPPKLSSVIKCKDTSHDKVRELLADALLKVSSEADEYMIDEVNACDPFRVAVSVESALFEKWGLSNGPHKFKYRSILFNIRDSKNPDFRRKVLLGHVNPERLVEMSPEEMASNQRQLENKKIKEKALFECQRKAAPKATCCEFRCGRCGKKETTYHQMQTRSADEPMTTFMTCVSCGHKWKFC